MGMSPVSLLGVAKEYFTITEGTLKETKGYGSLVNGWCEDCGCRIRQGPSAAPFYAVFPTNFHIEDGKNCKIPKELMPDCHINYENRIRDWKDDLPKYNGLTPDSGQVDVCGNPIGLQKTEESTETTKKCPRPTQKDISSSWCLYIKAELKFDHGKEGMPTTYDHFRAHAKTGVFKPWSQINGLRNKVFWLHEESNTAGVFYTFFTR
jgi:hypothetical protein